MTLQRLWTNKHSLFIRLAPLAAMMLFLANLLMADVAGSILGTVTDQSGAVIPGAAVTLKHASTGLKVTTTTNAVGGYQFLAVPVGAGYVVEVEAAGFRKASETGIKLLVNQGYRADFQLQVGATAQAVSVSASAVQVETVNTQLGDVIEDRKMTTLPLNGRSYIDLLGLQAGVVPMVSNSSNLSMATNRVSGLGFAGLLSVNGGRESANAFLVNGGDVEESQNNGAGIAPTLDSIQEFRLLTNSFDAEYGRFSGAIVNVITKSGSNGVHGTLYEFLRNEKLDARNFFDRNQSDPISGQELPGTAIGAFKQNMFGFAIGGPVAKNRLFFFTDYQGTRQVRGASSGVILVPSASERGGDFSDVATTGYPGFSGTVRGDSVPGNHSWDETLSSRLGYAVTSGEPYFASGCNTLADAQAGTCVFPGQVIPTTAFGPVAPKTLQFFMSPNATLSNGHPFFSTSAFRGTFRNDKWAQRIDFHNQLTGNWGFYYHFDDSSNLNPYAGGIGIGSVTPARAQQMQISNTRNFGASAVNEARFNFTRFYKAGDKPLGGEGPVTDFGFVSGGLGLIQGAPPYEGLPGICVGQIGYCTGMPSITILADNTFSASDNFSKIVGRHTVKFGADYRYLQLNPRSIYNGGIGSFGFYGNETGNAFADYLLGAPDSFGQASLQHLDARTHYFGAYAQDSFKLRPNLTLNYGLRWEILQPWYDKYDHLQEFIPGVQSQVFPDAPEGWVFPGDPGVARSLAPRTYNNLGPRVGLAYSPGFSEGALGIVFGGPGKTSIRAAFGIYYTSIEQVANAFEMGDSPFGNYYGSPVLVYMEEPYKARQDGADPGQKFPFVEPAKGATGMWANFQPVSSSQTYNNQNRAPYTEHFNLNIQRQFGDSVLLTLAYVGSRGRRLLYQADFSPGNPVTCLAIRAALGPDAGCGEGGEDRIHNLGNGQFAYGTRPYSITSGRLLTPGGGTLDFGMNPMEYTLGKSSYNALQVSLEKRVGALRVLGAYTWSKSMDNSSGFHDQVNPYNPAASRSLSAFDLAHNFVISYSYELPFAKLLHSNQGVMHKCLAGWDVSGITHFSTGLPVLLKQSRDLSLCGCGYGDAVDLPNNNGQPIAYSDPRTSGLAYFSGTPFSLSGEGAALGTIGNANRRFFHGPGLNNFDMALRKTTRINERVAVEFRAEFFNIFNHAQFYGPNGDFTSSAFGLVSRARDPRIGQVALKLTF